MVRGVLPTLDYQACYFAKVVEFNFDRQQVDLEPDAVRDGKPLLPTMQGVPFRGPAGALWTVAVGTEPPPTVLVTWENGDPSRPVAFGFGTGAHVLRLTLNADQIYLGGEDGAEPAAKGKTLQDYLNSLAQALTAHTHVAPSGGGPTSPAATAGTDLLPSTVTPPDVLATNAKVK